jgi:hypothetical protein
VSTTLVMVIRGRDGKLYPAQRRSDAELDRIVVLTHQARCELGLSVRATVDRLAGYGIRRSVGAVARDLALYQCSRCKDRAL